MYSISNYGAMIADRVRVRAYAEALRQAITRDSVVLDLGTGTGIFALLACRFGARRVYAIEPSDAVQVAREIAAANGFAGRIEFWQALSTDVTLPERADVIVSDIGGDSMIAVWPAPCRGPSIMSVATGGDGARNSA